MPAGNRHLPVVETRRLPQTYGLVWQRTSFSNRKPFAGDRRLTSFYRTSTARETQCWQWSPTLQGQSTMPKSYVYCLPEIDFPRELYTRLHSALALLTGNRLLPHTVYKGGKNSTWTVGFHLCFIIQHSVGLSNKLGIKARRGKRRALRFSCP